MNSIKTQSPPSEQRRRLALFALGCSMGFLASLIFWAIYFFQSFTVPVPDIIRFKSAAIGTIMIFAIIFMLMYRKQIQSILERAFEPK